MIRSSAISRTSRRPQCTPPRCGPARLRAPASSAPIEGRSPIRLGFAEVAHLPTGTSVAAIVLAPGANSVWHSAAKICCARSEALVRPVRHSPSRPRCPVPGGPPARASKRQPRRRGAAGPGRAPQPVHVASPRANSPPGLKRQQPLRGPQGHRRCPGPGTLQADLAKVQLLGSEVGVRRVVLVEAAHAGVAKEHAAAAVGLQPVLVRIDDDRVGLIDHREGPPRRLVQRLRNQL